MLRPQVFACILSFLHSAFRPAVSMETALNSSDGFQFKSPKNRFLRGPLPPPRLRGEGISDQPNASNKCRHDRRSIPLEHAGRSLNTGN
jgi:hypothetical protein